MAQTSQYRRVASPHLKADLQCREVLIQMLSGILLLIWIGAIFPWAYLEASCCLSVSSTSDDSMNAPSDFFFFFFFLVTQCYLNSSLKLHFFCFHFHVSFRKKNILRSGLSCKERRCVLHGPNTDRGCVPRSCSPPVAGHLRLGSSATNQLDSKVNSCPAGNMLLANFELVRVINIYSSLF